MRPRTKQRFRAARSPSLPAALTLSIRTRTNPCWSRSSPTAAAPLARCGLDGSRGRGIFPVATASLPGWPLATVVVEAAERSGSLITARLALEQNREVLAVPGSPLDPRAAGSNNLLKQGARLVTQARDVVEVLTPMLKEPLPTPEPGLLKIGRASCRARPQSAV